MIYWKLGVLPSRGGNSRISIAMSGDMWATPVSYWRTAMPDMVEVPPRCLHCKRNKAHQSRARGLCGSCYEDKEIRSRYPKRSPQQSNWNEPTMEQLEAMIEERRSTMPPRYSSRKKRKKKSATTE